MGRIDKIMYPRILELITIINVEIEGNHTLLRTGNKSAFIFI